MVYTRKGYLSYFKVLKWGATVWCPFDKELSAYVKILKDSGFKVIYSHIEDGKDFLNYEPDEHYDYIVSNPPFSIKDDIFKRAFELNKPFALIMDVTKIFDSRKRWELFSKKDFELVYLSPRVNFIDPEKGQTSGAPFQSAYVCSNICDDQINFEKMIAQTK